MRGRSLKRAGRTTPWWLASIDYGGNQRLEWFRKHIITVNKNLTITKPSQKGKQFRSQPQKGEGVGGCQPEFHVHCPSMSTSCSGPDSKLYTFSGLPYLIKKGPTNSIVIILVVTITSFMIKGDGFAWEAERAFGGNNGRTPRPTGQCEMILMMMVMMIIMMVMRWWWWQLNETVFCHHPAVLA